MSVSNIFKFFTFLFSVLFTDSPESVQREIGILFPEFSEEHWLKEEKHHFENGTVYFDTERFIHRIKDQSCQIDPTVNADGPQAG